MTILDLIVRFCDVAAVGFLAFGAFTVFRNSQLLRQIATGRFEFRVGMLAPRGSATRDRHA
jgi:hypothetical protein